MHGYSEKDWIKFIDNELKDSERQKFEVHLAECGDCHDFHRRMVRVEKSLSDTGLQIRDNQIISDNQVNVGLAKVLARILDNEAKGQNLGKNEIRERLEQLEDILAVMCGSWTAVNALRVAAEKTIAGSPEKLSKETWIPFLEKLKGIAGVFCGETGAKLVWEYGQL